MGVSTDAILFFGVNLGGGEDDELPEGVYEKLAEDYEWVEKLEEDFNVEVIHHCSDQYTMYALAAKGSAQRAYRGSVVEVKSLDEKKTWFVNVKAALKFMSIVETPKWLLVSWWG